jgi:hypothetical protein
MIIDRIKVIIEPSALSQFHPGVTALTVTVESGQRSVTTSLNCDNIYFKSMFSQMLAECERIITQQFDKGTEL